jgi:hypothetical protein
MTAVMWFLMVVGGYARVRMTRHVRDYGRRSDYR